MTGRAREGTILSQKKGLVCRDGRRSKEEHSGLFCLCAVDVSSKEKTKKVRGWMYRVSDP